MSSRQVLGISIVLVIINIAIIYFTKSKETKVRYINVVDEYVKNMQQWIKSKENSSAKNWYDAILKKGARREEMIGTASENVVYGKKYFSKNTVTNSKTEISKEEYDRRKTVSNQLEKLIIEDDKENVLELKNIDYYIVDDVTFGLKNYNNLKAFNIQIPLSVVNEYRKTLNLPTI